MHPELLRIGSLSIPTYGFALALAFLASILLLRRRAASAQLSPDDASDFAVWVLLAGLAGAKLLLVVVEWPRYVSSVRDFLDLFRAGGVFYGGLLGALVAAAVFLRSRKLPFWPLADAAAPCVALGQAIGRLGCFSAGCCWGGSCSQPWAVTFTSTRAHENVGVPLGVPLHPTQLYEAAGTLLLCGLLLFFEKRRFSGQTFAWYLIGYSLLRGTIEIFRGDPRGSLLGGAVSTSQFIAALLLLLGVAILVIRRPKGEAEPTAA